MKLPQKTRDTQIARKKYGDRIKAPGARSSMVSLLNRLGVARPTYRDSDGTSLPIPIPRLTEGQLYDVYDRARRVYREHVAQAHPDRGGNQEQCARLNRIWARLQGLFKRKGIGNTTA